jgi:hypothetical protein
MVDTMIHPSTVNALAPWTEEDLVGALFVEGGLGVADGDWGVKFWGAYATVGSAAAGAKDVGDGQFEASVATGADVVSVVVAAGADVVSVELVSISGSPSTTVTVMGE